MDNSATGTRPWAGITGVFVYSDNVYASGVSTYLFTGGAFAPYMTDFSVRLWENGIPVGNDNANGNSLPAAPPYPASVYVGTWGLSLTYQDVNNPEFGVAWAGMISGSNHAPQYTHYMVAKNFGFNIPTGATIVNVIANVYAGVRGIAPGEPNVLLIDYISMEIDYTQDYYMQGVQSVQGIGTITF